MTLNLPYYLNVQYVEIFNPQRKELLEFDVSDFVIYNENEICEKGEK